MAKKKITEIIPREKISFPKWVRLVFYSSLLAVIGVGIVSLIIMNKVASLREQEKNLNQQLKEVSSGREIQRQLKKKEKKIADVKQLWAEHQAGSRFFTWLESFIHPQVQLTSLQVFFSEHKAHFEARGPRADIAEEQILILSGREDINNWELSDISLGKEGQVRFSIDFSFSPEILNFR